MVKIIIIMCSYNTFTEQPKKTKKKTVHVTNNNIITIVCCVSCTNVDYSITLSWIQRQCVCSRPPAKSHQTPSESCMQDRKIISIRWLSCPCKCCIYTRREGVTWVEFAHCPTIDCKNFVLNIFRNNYYSYCI